MPRPKPDGVMVRRTIAMTEAHWLMFDQKGGASWLRNHIGRMAIAVNAHRERNNRMKAMRAAGLSSPEIARQLGVHRSTVMRNSMKPIPKKKRKICPVCGNLIKDKP